MTSLPLLALAVAAYTALALVAPGWLENGFIQPAAAVRDDHAVSRR